MRILLAVILAVTSLLAGCVHQVFTEHAEAPLLVATPQPGTNYVAVIGDSYTSGSPAGGSKSSPANWVNRIKTEMQAFGLDMRPIVGATGSTGYISPGRKATPNRFADQAKRVVGTNDSLVVLFGSRNDSQAAPEELTPRVFETLSEVRRLAPNARILMIGPIWPNPTPTLAVQRNRDVLATQAQEFGATFIDPVGDQWF